MHYCLVCIHTLWYSELFIWGKFLSLRTCWQYSQFCYYMCFDNSNWLLRDEEQVNTICITRKLAYMCGPLHKFRNQYEGYLKFYHLGFIFSQDFLKHMVSQGCNYCIIAELTVLTSDSLARKKEIYLNSKITIQTEPVIELLKLEKTYNPQPTHFVFPPWL